MTRIIIAALVALVVIGTVGTSHAAEIRCDIQSKVSCSSSGCIDNQPGAWNLIDIDSGRISRCDKKGCDQYAMTVTRSGAYLNIEVPGRGILVKMLTDGSDYLEVVTLGTTALVSHGTCK